MYEADFGTDWTKLDREEAFERSYALGVAAVVADPLPEERERVVATADSTYEETLLELAYEEGKKDAQGVTATGAETVWDEVVGDEAVDLAEAAVPDDESVPEMLGRVDVLDGQFPDRFGGLDLPDVLRRE